MSQYLSDEQIESPYLAICEEETQIHVDLSKENSGWIQISMPQNEQRNRVICQKDDYCDDDLLDEEKTDSFIIYEHSGQIAFDAWYPESVYVHLVKSILNKFKDDPKTLSQQKALDTYAHLL